MEPDQVQSVLEGKEGPEAQVAMLKYVIGLQIDRAFGLIQVRSGGNIHMRDTLQGPSLNYNERGDSNLNRRTH
jgi:hypothetical protein